jgi:hypothetical protein
VGWSAIVRRNGYETECMRVRAVSVWASVENIRTPSSPTLSTAPHFTLLMLSERILRGQVKVSTSATSVRSVSVGARGVSATAARATKACTRAWSVSTSDRSTGAGAEAYGRGGAEARTHLHLL